MLSRDHPDNLLPPLVLQLFLVPLPGEGQHGALVRRDAESNRLPLEVEAGVQLGYLLHVVYKLEHLGVGVGQVGCNEDQVVRVFAVVLE